MNKAERLMYCESLMTHAMMFTAVNLVVRNIQLYSDLLQVRL